MSRRGPWGWVAAFALAACRAGAGAAGEGQADGPVVVRCVAPERRTVDDTVALRGRIEPPPGGDLPVASQVPGRLAQVAVREGQSIREGDVVATVDDANTRDALRQADAALAQARATAENARVTLERTRALVARGIAARQELDDATAKSGEASASVAAVAASADLARRALGRVAVRSSFAGVVTKVWRGAGALVDGTAATPVIQLSATGAIEFVADATAAELSRVSEGDAAHGALVDGSILEGAVRTRSRALDPSTGLGSVRVAVSKLPEGIPVGAYGRVVIVLDHRDGVRTLPASALRGAILDGAQVAVCKDGKAEIRTVRVGWRDEDRFEVAEGVSDGERVAVDHVLGLEEGTAIAEGP